MREHLGHTFDIVGKVFKSIGSYRGDFVNF